MILCCGEALIDMLPELNSKGKRVFLPVPGGSPYNTAIAIARLGTNSAFLGKISSDFFGDILVENLTQNNVGMDFIRRVDKNTTLAFVDKGKDGSARYAFYSEDSADRDLRLEDIPEELSDEVKCIEFGSISLLLEPGSNTIRDLIFRECSRRIISFDPNIRPGLIKDRGAYLEMFDSLVGCSHILKASDEDIKWLYPDMELEEAAHSLIERGASIVIVTMAEKGAFVICHEGLIKVDAIDVPVADTVGAGDTFHAAFLSYLHEKNLLEINEIKKLKGDRVRSALEFAIKAASITCSRPGADPPFKNEMNG